MRLSKSVQTADLRFWSQSRFAFALLALACATWTLVFAWQSRSGPAQRHIEAGLTYEHGGRHADAVSEWQEAVKADPNNVTAWRLLGFAYIASDRWAEAEEAFRRLQRLKPDEPDIDTSLTTCAFRANDFGAAMNYAQEALKRHPDDLGALATAVYCAPELGDQTVRLGYLRRLVRLRPDDLDYLLMLATPLTNKLQFAEARPLVDHILALDPANAQGYAMRGFIRFTESPSPQSLALAEADLRRSLDLNPNNQFALFHLGRLYKQKAQPAKAIPLLERAAALTPNQHQPYYELAEAYQQAGDMRKATAARQKFAALRNQKDHDTLLEKRVVSYPNDFTSNLEYGLVLLKRGDLQKAQVCLERAQRLRPEDNRAAAGLRELTALTDGSRRSLSFTGEGPRP